MALAKYLASDAPGNVERAILKHQEGPLQANWGDSFRQFRAQYDGYWRNTERRTRMLGNEANAQSWGWCNITTWQDADQSPQEKAATIPPRMREFLTGTGNNEPVAYQWVMAADVELAQAWLMKAMSVTPEQIATMPWAEQKTAIIDMWASFANYFKAINVVPQAWAKYRDAWEAATRTGTELVLKSPSGRPYPRPCASQVWFPHERGSALTGSWLGEAVTAIHNSPHFEMQDEYTFQRIPKPDQATTPIRFGSGYPMQPTGSGEWGQPPISSIPQEGWNKTLCQESVVVGAACFSPMHQSHFVWLNANAYLTGGMNPVVAGSKPYFNSAFSYLEARAHGHNSDVSEPVWHFTQCPDVMGGSWAGVSSTAEPVDTFNNWRTCSMAYVPMFASFADEYTGAEGRKYLYQPPPKRYVDLLWPMLEYLAARPAQEIAWEVMIDVMGKNAFSAIISGSTPDIVQRNLAANMGEQRQTYVRAQEADATLARFVEGVVGTIATVVASAVGGPLAGAAVGSGLAVIFAGVNAAMAPGAASSFSANALYDVFGRADSVGSGDERYGMIERYLMVGASPSIFIDAAGQIYDHIRQRTQNSGAESTWLAPSTFVMPGPIPAPVGFPLVATPGTGRRRSQNRAQGGIRRPHGTIRTPGGATITRLVEPETVRPLVAASAGVSPTAMVAAGCLAGAAGGLVLAGRGRPRQNPPRARRKVR